MEYFTERLTTGQLNYLKALQSGTSRICSKESLVTFQLKSSSRIARIKQSLEEKEIIEIHRDQVQIIDPVLNYRLAIADRKEPDS